MKNKKIMVISAHPDDLDFGCSGTIATLSKDNKICYVICTSGEKGFKNKELTDQEKMDTREKEQRDAAKVVGVSEAVFLRQKDGEVENTPQLRKEIVKQIRIFKPNVLFAQDPAMHKFDNFYRYHPDHRAVAHAVFDAVYPAVGNHLFFPELLKEGHHPHQLEEIYFFGTDSPNYWVDITPVLNLKIRALASHKSQIKDISQVEPFIKERCKAAANGQGMDYAECFRRLPIPP